MADCIISPIFVLASLPNIRDVDILIKLPASGVVSYSNEVAMWIPDDNMQHIHAIFETQWLPIWEQFLSGKTDASISKKEIATQIWAQLFPTPAVVSLYNSELASHDVRAALAFRNAILGSSQISAIVRISVTNAVVVAKVMFEAE